MPSTYRIGTLGTLKDDHKQVQRYLDFVCARLESTNCLDRSFKLDVVSAMSVMRIVFGERFEEKS